MDERIGFGLYQSSENMLNLLLYGAGGDPTT